MCNPNYLANAIENVLMMDVPDHLFTIAISDQAKLYAGIECDSGVFNDWLATDFSIQPFQ